MMYELQRGDTVRLRRAGTEDDWCVCRADHIDGAALGLRVLDGALRLGPGEVMMGAIAVVVEGGRVYNTATRTELDIEVWQAGEI
jgi:hypothetical protein